MGAPAPPARWFRAAVSAVTAAVSSLIFCSIDMMKTPFGWTWDYSEAILDERFNDFTQEITRLAEVPRLTMKFLVDLCRDPCGQKLVQIWLG